MTLALLLTTAVSLWVLNTPQVLEFFMGRPLVLMGLFILQIVMVVAIVGALNRIPTGVATALYFAYAALMGFTLSSIFIVYDIGVITMAFGVTAVIFLVLSVVGLTTKQDLTRWGPILFFGLIGLILATVVNIFLRSSALDMIITYAGVLIFMGLIVYDTKYIKEMTYQVAAQGGDTGTAVGRLSVLGALKLYLDFINLFLFILRIFSRR
jgi:FtsH-binding integral membrane protein